MRNLRLYAPAIAWMIGAGIALVVTSPVTAVICGTLTVGALYVHTRETMQRSRH